MTEQIAGFRAEARRLAAEMQAGWSEQSTTLEMSYRLLDAGDVESALVDDMIDVYFHSGSLAFPVKDHDNGEYIFANLHKIVPRLCEIVTEKLRDGTLEATAIAPGDELRAKRTPIPAESWAVLTPDFKRSLVFGHGKLAGSAVEVARVDIASSGSNVRPISQPELEGWFRTYMKECGARIPSRDEELEAAIAKFADRVTRERVRALRDKLAPAWNRKAGRPRKSAK